MKENLYLETKENFFAQREEDVRQYQPLDESRIAFRVSLGLSSLHCGRSRSGPTQRRTHNPTPPDIPTYVWTNLAFKLLVSRLCGREKSEEPL